MKTLNKLLNELYGDRALDRGEEKFVQKHMGSPEHFIKNGKDYAGNSVDGPPYKAGIGRKKQPRHGYDAGQDTKVYEDHNPDSKAKYDEHHAEAIKHLTRMIDHLNNHKKTLDKHSKKEDFHVSHPYWSMKEYARKFQDMAEDVTDHFSTDMNTNAPEAHPYKPKHQMGGLKYNNYKVSK